MEKKSTTDRRITRSKSAIKDALVLLLAEKEFSAITVSDIVNRANINRGTFYLHYQDKYDLLEQIQKDVLIDLSNISRQAKKRKVSGENNTDPLHRLILLLLEYIRDHADVMTAILGLPGDESFAVRMRDLMEESFKQHIYPGLDIEKSQVPWNYMIAYLFNAHIGVIRCWLTAGCQEAPQEIAHILFLMSSSGPFHAAAWNGINEP